MSVIKDILIEEKERNLLMQNQYLQEIAALPKGSLVKKAKKSGDYYYLHYRVGNKVFSDYVGNDTQEVDKIRLQINKRKHLVKLVKNLENELKQITKVIK